MPMEDRYNVECCDFIHIHKGSGGKGAPGAAGEDTLYDLTELFRIFADSTRVRILYVLLESEMCVCDIADLLGLTQSAISHQLRALKTPVWSPPAGRKTVFYALADDHVKTIIDQGLEHVSSDPCQHEFYGKQEEPIMKKAFQTHRPGLCQLRRQNGDGHQKIDGVSDASVSFLTQKMTIDADEARFDDIMRQVVAVCKKVEPDCVIHL